MNDRLKSYIFNPSLRVNHLHPRDGKRAGQRTIAIRSASGFTVMELLVVITIISIILGISTLAFHSMQVKSNIEAETRVLFTDIMDARTKAFTQKKAFGIVFQPTSYTMRNYSSEVEYVDAAAAAANGNILETKNLKYSITNAGADISNSYVVFDTNGFALNMNMFPNNLFTIFVNPVTGPASLNCVTISEARANMGKINGASCEFR